MPGVISDLLKPFPQLNVTLLVGKDNHKRQDSLRSFFRGDATLRCGLEALEFWGYGSTDAYQSPPEQEQYFAAGQLAYKRKKEGPWMYGFVSEGSPSLLLPR